MKCGFIRVGDFPGERPWTSIETGKVKRNVPVPSSQLNIDSMGLQYIQKFRLIICV